MTFDEDIESSYLLAEFFWHLEANTEQDYKDRKISRKQRNELIKAIRESWDATMRENDPLTKNNPLLREIADGLSKFRDGS